MKGRAEVGDVRLPLFAEAVGTFWLVDKSLHNDHGLSIILGINLHIRIYIQLGLLYSILSQRHYNDAKV